MDNTRILIVDDDPSLVRLVKARLAKRDGYEILTASSGFEAVNQAPSIKPDLVLLDWVMPGMSGIQVLRELKGTEGLENTIFMMLTARNLIGELEEAFALGAEGYLIKPVQLELLSQKVNEALAHRSKEENGLSSVLSSIKELI